MVKEKNWLIRTTNFQILGPVSKEKIVEFVTKGSLKDDDEITSGNGYWFLIKEKDLLEKYIIGNMPQTFNPITEAPNVLTANLSPDHTGTHSKILNAKSATAKEASEEEINLPTEDDLEYPDMGAPSGELSLEGLDTAPQVAAGGSTPVTAVAAGMDNDDGVEGLLPEAGDLEYPDMGDGPQAFSSDEFDEGTSPTNPLIGEFDEETDPSVEIPNVKVKADPLPKLSKSEKKVVKKSLVKKPAAPKKTQRNDRLLFFLTSVFFVTFLFAAIVYYYKKVLNKPIPFIGEISSISLISSAHAQNSQVDSLIKKKRLLDFKEIVDGEIKFTPVLDLRGFDLKVLEAPELKDCGRLKNFFVQFFILLSKSQDTLEQYDDFINSCFLEMDKDYLVLLNLSQEDLVSRAKFEKYLIEAGAGKKLRKKAIEIYKIKNKRRAQISVIEKLVEVTSLELPKQLTPEKYKTLYSYLKIVENTDKDNPARQFIELAVALRTNNTEWVRNISKKIINSSALQYAVFFERKKMRGKTYLQFINALFDTLSLMKKTTKEPMVLRMLVTRLLFFIPIKHKARFNSEFNGNWSLNELREIVANRKYGQMAVGLWYNVLENRTTDAEVERYLDNILRRGALKKLPFEEFWLLKYFFPGDKRRQVLNKRLVSFLSQKNSVHDNLILSEILEKEPIQKSLSKIEPRLGKALFKVKRELYQDVLKSGYPSTFSLYNLFLMGEKDPELFWWFVL